ncbi:MAG: SDR family NAD(P)-dependent oxidoreductase [Pyrinomonadaceae bacterium]|nr:SDR family NAD(P)-dependent oxidoreductase [Pyrinomonadaceae bacterium]MBP9108428.1 SDR family NAD(P)-dependent oxidoreductase [Pyrinomonadaceae bacterium]
MTLDPKSVVVITGAASGIGRALAVRIASEGVAGIAISDVNEAGLNGTAAMITGVPVSTHVMDVSKLDDVKQFAGGVIAKHGRVTHLINNAGVGVLGSFEQLSIEDFEWLMGINFWGVIYGCKVFLPLLKAQPQGHIVNVSSVFGLIAPEEQSAYCSSKFAVRGFTESLRHELAGSTVSVSCVHPGGIKTNIARNSRVGENTPEEWKQQGAKFFDKVAKTSPETAAEVILKGIKEQNPRILIGQDAYAISTLSRLFPAKYLRMIERLSGHKMSLRKK